MILFIDASVRQDSRTRRLAKMYLDPDSASLLPESITGKHK